MSALTLLAAERADHVPERQEALVDRDGLLEALSGRSGLLLPLRSRQIHQMKLCRELVPGAAVLVSHGV